MDCSPLGSSVHRILQATVLKWVAIPCSRGSSETRPSLLRVSDVGPGEKPVKLQKLGERGTWMVVRSLLPAHAIKRDSLLGASANWSQEEGFGTPDCPPQ